MTRSFFDPTLHSCSRPPHMHGMQQRFQHCDRAGFRPASGKGHGGSYSASMASMAGHHGPPTGGLALKRSNTHERRNSFSSQCPPVSTSHLLAVHLGEVYPPNTCKDSRGIFNGLVGAIERHILHSDPSGNVKIPSSLLHIGECPEVPEHLATFALRRSGSLHFRQPQDEAAEQQEEEMTNHMRRKGQLGHHSMSEPKLSTCAKPTMTRAANSACCDLASLVQTPVGSSGSSLSSAGGTPRPGGLRRTFSWHRIKDKLKR